MAEKIFQGEEEQGLILEETGAWCLGCPTAAGASQLAADFTCNSFKMKRE